MPLLSLCRAMTIDCDPSHVREVCLDFSDLSWTDGFAKSIEARSPDQNRVTRNGIEAEEGDNITFKGIWGTMEAVIVDNTERMFSFQSLDEIMTVYWEFVPLPHKTDAGEQTRTFFKHWEYHNSKPTHFWERHGPFKTANEEELDKFNDSLKKECERRTKGAQAV